MSESSTATTMKQLRITAIRQVAEGVNSYELEDPEGATLEEFSAGAHIAVQVPNGSIRKYSLCNSPTDRHRYVIAVKRDEQGRGGSISLTDDAHVGDLIPASAPENAFPLTLNNTGYLFIAGGIGITPILAMIKTLEFNEIHNWKLYYFTRNPETTAFLEELSDVRYQGKVHIHHDYGDQAKSFDIWPLLEKPSARHVYCCGPRGLMVAVRDMSGHWPEEKVHFESFLDGAALQRPDDKPFTVKLSRSGKTVSVPVGGTILESLRSVGCNVTASCESGSCGSCRTRLLGGQADHRDFVLTPHEKDDHIMVCVSRALSEELVLDL